MNSGETEISILAKNRYSRISKLDESGFGLPKVLRYCNPSNFPALPQEGADILQEIILRLIRPSLA